MSGNPWELRTDKKSGAPHHCTGISISAMQIVYGSLQRAPPHHVRLLLIRMISIDTSDRNLFSFQGDLTQA